MVTTMTLKELLDVLLCMHGTFILRHELGSMELHGNDFYLSSYNEWLTIYHTTAPKNPESRSHFHIKWSTLRSAAIEREEGHTPNLALYTTPEPLGEAPLVWIFPSFYDWANNKAEIPANQARYEAFVQQYGMLLQLCEPASEA